MMKNRAPYDAEVDAEVANEYERLQEEKRRGRPDHGREIEAVRTRVSDLEGTVTRLGENVAASHKRMEDMLQKILQHQGAKQIIAGDHTVEPSSSAQMVDTSALTSTTVAATTLPQQPAPVPIMTNMGVAEAHVTSNNPVGIHVAKDVAADVGLNIQEAQTNPNSVIAALVEEIIQGDSNKSTACNVGVDPAEAEPEEEPVAPMEDVEEGIVVTEGVVDALEEVGISEQVR